MRAVQLDDLFRQFFKDCFNCPTPKKKAEIRSGARDYIDICIGMQDQVHSSSFQPEQNKLLSADWSTQECAIDITVF